MPSSIPESPSISPRLKTGRPYWLLVWKRLRRDGLAMTGLWLVGALFLVAFFAPFLANNKPLLMSVNGELGSPMLREFFAPLQRRQLHHKRRFGYSGFKPRYQPCHCRHRAARGEQVVHNQNAPARLERVHVHLYHV